MTSTDRPAPQGTYRLERVQFLPLPREKVFAFFSDAGNLERITPDFLCFQILSPQPIEMKPGALIDYRLKLFGIPFNWRTEIESYEPPFRFTDTQVTGPYALWHHTHEFFEVDGGTLIVDTVVYDMPWWILGSFAHRVFVRDTLDAIFDHRKQVIEKLLLPQPSAESAPAAASPQPA